ncbi:MAG TPA: hypothetical protein V6C72_19680 [Chroococcales cyanobacterium]
MSGAHERPWHNQIQNEGGADLPADFSAYAYGPPSPAEALREPGQYDSQGDFGPQYIQPTVVNNIYVQGDYIQANLPSGGYMPGSAGGFPGDGYSWQGPGNYAPGGDYQPGSCWPQDFPPPPQTGQTGSGDFLNQAIDVGYGTLQRIPDGTVNVNGDIAKLESDPGVQAIERKFGLDLSVLSNVDSITKTDASGAVNVEVKSSKEAQIPLDKLLPGLSVNVGKDASFTVEDPKNSGQLTVDNFKNVTVSIKGVSVDPTSVVLDRAKDGNPEVQLSGKAAGAMPVGATIELEHGKPVVTNVNLPNSPSG